MSYSSTGAYTDIAGSTTATPGSIIQSATWNAIFTDLGNALSQVMSQLLGTTSVQRNILFGNGGFEVWQRGAGSSASVAVAATTTAYTADRWYLTTLANQACVVSAQTGITDQSLLSGRVIRNAGQTGTGVLTFGYPLDTESIVAMRGKAMSVSFYAKAGASWSPTSGTLTCALYVGTGAVAKRGAGFTSETTIFTGTAAVTTTATKFAIVGTTTVPTNSTQAELQFTWTPVGTAGADDSVYLDDVEVECQNSTTSDTWLTSVYDRVPFSVMLDDCQNHFVKTFPYATAPAQAATLTGALTLISNATSRQGLYWRYSNELRTTPTVTTYNPQGANANWQDVTGAVTSAVTVTATSTKGIFIYSATAAAADRLFYIQAQADAGI